MEKFAGYGFNKSHSAAYALVSYQTAWLKAHFPAPFMAAVLSADMDNTDKVVNLIDECRHMKLAVVAPDINRSGYAFTVEGDDTIIYGLGAIKGVGESAIEVMIQERLANGPFASLLDLCRRMDSRKVTRRVYEALIRAGALDNIGDNRASLMAQLPEAIKSAEQHLRDSAAGQSDMFGSVVEPTEHLTLATPAVPEWDEQQRLAGEKETLGLYLTGHPIDRYREELASIVTGSLAELNEAGPNETAAPGASRHRGQEKTVVVAGLVVDMRTRNTQSGARMAFVTLDDRSARMEIRLFSRVFEQYRALLANDKVLVVQGTLAYDDFSGSMRLNVDRIYEIDQAREVYARRLVLRVGAQKAGNGFMRSLADVLMPFCEGSCPVGIQYQGASAQAHLTLGEQWQVHPTDELLHRLRELAGDGDVRVIY
jgi:DNA polymerase-3 subunit alpha